MQSNLLGRLNGLHGGSLNDLDIFAVGEPFVPSQQFSGLGLVIVPSFAIPALTLTGTHVTGPPITIESAFIGTSGNDTITGTSGNDTFDLSQGGNDAAYGLAGHDRFNMGAAFNSADKIDGGTGNDSVYLNGNYTGVNALAMNATTMVNVETLSLAAGHSYKLTTNDTTVASGQTLTVDGSALHAASGAGPADTLTFNGAAETDGAFVINGGAGTNILTGGAGDDTFDMGAFLTSADKINGGPGTDDALVLHGDYTGANALVMNHTTMNNIEYLNLEGGYSYDLTTNNETTTAGQNLQVDARGLAAGATLTFNGSAEVAGFSFYIGPGTYNLKGGAGDDSFDIGTSGAPLKAADKIDGGPGHDGVYLDADYTGGNALVFGATTMVNVETLNLDNGSYDLTTNDATVASGKTLTVDATTLDASYSLTFNGSAETDGKFVIIGGAGNDVLTGGAGNDTFNLSYGGNDTASGGLGNDSFVMGAALTTADQIDGGSGTDTVTLSGDYATTPLVFGATTMVKVETLTLDSGFNYNLTTNDATVASGKTLTVNGSALGAGDSLTFNGSAETNGHFRITGGTGADHLTGGALSDKFVYTSAAQSTSTTYDTIGSFSYGLDRFDIPGAAGTITAIDAALATGTLDNGANFNSEMTTALNGHLGAHHAELFTASAGSLAGQTFLVVDLNGVAGYQAGADLIFHMTGATGTLATGDFI